MTPTPVTVPEGLAGGENQSTGQNSWHGSKKQKRHHPSPSPWEMEMTRRRKQGGGLIRVWRAWTIPLVARMSSTCESITRETEGSGGAKGLTTSEGMRVESGDGGVDHNTVVTTPGVTS